MAEHKGRDSTPVLLDLVPIQIRAHHPFQILEPPRFQNQKWVVHWPEEDHRIHPPLVDNPATIMTTMATIGLGNHK